MTKKIIKILLLLIVAYLAIFILLALWDFKQIATLTKNTYRGTNNINQAISLAKEKKYSEASKYSSSAQTELSTSLASIQKISNSPLSLLPLVDGQLQEIEHLITATELISRGLSKGLALAADIQVITNGTSYSNYQGFSEEQKIKLLDKLYVSAPELNGLRANFSLAMNELDLLRLHGLLWPIKHQIIKVREKISLGTEILDSAIPLSQILPSLAGYPSKSTYLIVLQNSDELRPTGGFIGTYGILETKNGDIARLDTHDIYHLDMPSQSEVKITPPEPIMLYLNDSWYMRDANWSPDWPTSAKKLQWFYNQENQYLTGVNDINKFNGLFDGVIAINPRLVSGLLSLVGPITIDNQIYSAENFSSALEYEVEQGYLEAGTSKWQRKEVIGKIIKELKIKLLNLPSSQWKNILASIQGSLNKKDLMFYFNDPWLNRLVASNNWDGEVRQTNDDFLMLVDSNFASLKTDSVISRQLHQTIEQDGQELKATLAITYKNDGQFKDWRTDRYKNYARLYVPKGSRLIKFDGATVPVSISEENNKTVFGSLFYIELNSSKTITISYYLPDYIVQKWKQGQYGLYWQKQPGSRVVKTQVDVLLPSKVKLINPHSGIISSGEKKVSWPLDLTTDQEISLNF